MHGHVDTSCSNDGSKGHSQVSAGAQHLAHEPDSQLMIGQNAGRTC